MLNNFHRSHFARQVNVDMIGKRVRLAGWLEDSRDIGRLAFLIVRDVTGAAQAIVSGDKLQLAKDIPRQSVIVVSGLVQKTKAKDFAVEIKVEELIVLLKATHPLPIDPTGRVQSALDKRLDSRALDLRNPKVASIFRIRSTALQIIRESLYSKDFIEVNTPRIIGSASEGGANLFNLEYFNKRAYLAQSPQLYKEQLILALDRVFEIGPFFRAENFHTVRHLTEFISIDVEAAFVDYEEVMDILEDVIKNVAKGLRENSKANVQSTTGEIPKPEYGFKRLTYEQCIEELAKEGQMLKFGDDLSDASLRKLGEIHQGFYFIIDWPIKLKPFYIHEKEDNLNLSKSFDLQYGYLELASGGTRQHDSTKLRSRLIEQGLNPQSFTNHLKAFEWGMPPHSGWGLGFDRLMVIMTNSQNVREVVLYPRDTERLMP
jgi:aspartyl-tRNA synthetase